MRRRHWAALTGWCVACLIWGPAGCTSVVPEALRGAVDRRLTYAQLAQAPESYRGRLVLVGGEVMRVGPAGPDLELTLAERPLSPVDESPLLGLASRGDLVVQVPGGARAALREGDVLTVVGVVLGREAGNDAESVPRLEARHLQVWPAGSLQPYAAEPGW